MTRNQNMGSLRPAWATQSVPVPKILARKKRGSVAHPGLYPGWLEERGPQGQTARKTSECGRKWLARGH